LLLIAWRMLETWELDPAIRPHIQRVVQYILKYIRSVNGYYYYP
jgi:hypothetical protein